MGTLRDDLVAGRILGRVVFAPGVALEVIDALLWAGLTAMAIAVMRVVSGPAQSDRLARRSADPVSEATDGRPT